MPAVAADLDEGPARRLLLPSLASVPGLVHAFTVRGSDPASVLRAMAGGPLPLATLRQIHGADVCLVGPDGAEPWTRNPRGPAEGTRRVSRGGAWRHADPWSAVGHRSSLPPALRYSDYGVRLAR